MLRLLLFLVLVGSQGGGSSAQQQQQQSPATTTTGGVTSTITEAYKQALPPITKFSADLNNPRVLNVHVVPHSHNDVGRLKTVEQYYYGFNNTIQTTNVQASLNSIIQALQENENRTFTFAEQRYFSMYWFGLNNSYTTTRNSIKSFLDKQQLSFASGGWSMADEACTHFIGLIDQITTGHEFLKQTFNYIPKVAWQLDAYGHSSTQATLLTSKMGMDAIYFGRIDYQDLQQRRVSGQTEGLWSPSVVDHLKDDTTIFWSLTGSYSGNYGPPNGFGHAPNDLLQTMSTQQRIYHITNMLLPQLATQALQTQGNHIMLTMGTDFDYQIAPIGFASMDLMIQETNRLVNQDMSKDNITQQQLMSLYFHDNNSNTLRYDSINLFYSSPEYYTQCKFQKSRHGAHDAAIVTPPSNGGDNDNDNSDDIIVDYTVKTDDFFPYADKKDSYWTGYYTSRTSLKRLERVASSFLMAARQMEALVVPVNATTTDCDCGQSTFALEDAMGVMQHHDAITGTAKQHVAFDYAKRIQSGINKALPFMIDKLKHMFILNDTDAFWQDLTFCQLLNETICPVSEQITKSSQVGGGDEEHDDTIKNDLYVIVYNPLAQEQSTVIQLPVGSNQSTYLISRVGGGGGGVAQEESTTTSLIKVKAVAVPENEKLPGIATANFYINFYTGNLPPVGAAFYKITTTNDDATEQSNLSYDDNGSLSTVRNGDGIVRASNGLITVQFDELSGELIGIEAKDDTSVAVQQTWGFYTSAPYSSDAYVFRPMGDEVDHPFQSIEGSIVETRDAIESHVRYQDGWIYQVTRLGKGNDYLEVEYTVGPVPIDDHKGKEIVTRYNALSSINNEKVCYTDANGREFQRRKYNHRETWDLDVTQTVAGNYYPVTTAIYIEDDNAALSIVTDRALGGACLENGVIELMVQRRILYDDGRVGECLNETTIGVTPYPPFGDAKRQGTGIVIRGKHRLSIGKGNRGASLSRSVMDKAFAEPLVFVASHPTGETPNFRSSYISALKQTLPKNIMLITYLRRRSDLFLVRLAHQYAPGEDPALSEATEIDLSLLFRDYRIKSIRETTLSGNQDYQAWVDQRMDWTGTGTLSPPFNVDDASNTATMVTIQPMDVRTFHIEVISLSTSNEPAPPSPPFVPVPDSTSATAAPTITPVSGSTSTGAPASFPVAETEKPTTVRPAPVIPPAPTLHHSQTHKSNPVSSAGSSQDSPSRLPVYFTIAGLAAIAVFLLYRRRKAQQRGRYNLAAGEQTFDMDMELQVSSYQPGLL